jgi:hypothetical protein
MIKPEIIINPVNGLIMSDLNYTEIFKKCDNCGEYKECHVYYPAGCLDGRDNPRLNLCYECLEYKHEDIQHALTGNYHQPKPYSLVTYCGDDEVYEQYYKNVFDKTHKLLYLSEVENMKDHCILCNLTTGKMIGPLHYENFRMLRKDEI